MTWTRGAAAWLPHGTGWTAVEVVSVDGTRAIVKLVLLRGERSIDSHAARRSVPVRDLVLRDRRRAGFDRPKPIPARRHEAIPNERAGILASGASPCAAAMSTRV